ncbi:MAG TPA: uracil-DNA glycosylase [Candidatus Moranbacteria bacterium]|nr:MAG: Phage SPO1 DNA polymerase-related protein [Candidatus Moranbacteria bacterium GW2011_GWD1_36_198]KKQ00167.1 MAG: Phage SPO1 DNA polymerase-related protein [Candidatus Moranbacteria bacterium GW2011_GWD2_36_198]HAS00068.1 uracil-DNA glycosylase [Candidatus Moranbacteria bacterium]HBI50707.1 uracil-DNA glycosylase [Candidatus Moranbacteria bacterium]HBU10780.1 uracil-DNA glycosylase [Candidatus Moranbacteria bacterium]
MSKQKKLEKLNKKMSVCNNCKLRKNCSHVVFGAGNPEAKIIFIGEAPGKKEDELGVPFVGSTGRILDKMLASIKIKREDVYLTNICKCRPPENRDPLPEEVAECWPWLEKQIAIISPTIIITLGKYALNSFLPTAKISEVHGKIIDVEIKKIGKIKLFPLHHPAAARINRKTKALFEEDFQKIPNLLQSKKEQ